MLTVWWGIGAHRKVEVIEKTLFQRLFQRRRRTVWQALFIPSYFPCSHHQVLKLCVADGAAHTVSHLEGMRPHWVIIIAIFFLPSTQLVEGTPDLPLQALPACWWVGGVVCAPFHKIDPTDPIPTPTPTHRQCPSVAMLTSMSGS